MDVNKACVFLVWNCLLPSGIWFKDSGEKPDQVSRQNAYSAINTWILRPMSSYLLFRTLYESAYHTRDGTRIFTWSTCRSSVPHLKRHGTWASANNDRIHYHRLSPKSALKAFTSFSGHEDTGSRRPKKKRSEDGSSTKRRPPIRSRWS